MKRIILAQPRGFCAGVQRAVDIVEKSINKFGSPVYVRHEIVHNKHVVDSLTEKGAIFVDEISDIPDNSNTIFSAHGVSDKVETDAKIKSLSIVDATCPLVKKVHVEALKYYEQGYKIILVGHKGHPEVEGTATDGKIVRIDAILTMKEGIFCSMCDYRFANAAVLGIEYKKPSEIEGGRNLDKFLTQAQHWHH